jgi:hypothetical protein
MWVYTTYLATAHANEYVPGDLLLAGSQVSRMGAAYEEYSEEADILNYNTQYKMRNYLFTTRLSYDITGTAYATVLYIALKDPRTGKTSYLWSDYQEWKALREWTKRCEKMLVYTRSNMSADGTFNLKGTNGRPVYIPAGLIEQISPSNHKYYNELSADLIEDFLFDLSYCVLGEAQRKFVALTGEMGLKEWNRILMEKASALQLIDTTFVSGSGQALTLGGQFVTYKMTNGIELTVKHFAPLDNDTDNRKLDPVTLRPLSSFTFLILDMSPKDGEANIVKVVRKGREMMMWNTSGSIAPGVGGGKSIQTVRSNAKDGYAVHFLGEMGIMVRDPRACGILEKIAE